MVGGHAWTLWPVIQHLVRPRRAPHAAPWGTTLVDPEIGRVALTGLLREPAGARGVLVVVHGLGGSATSRYTLAAAAAAEAAGLACLRLNLRGADRSGQDLHHAGLTDDLAAALASPALARFERVLVLGYSLGGHMVLRYAAGPVDPRVQAIAAICPPLDLDLCARALDASRSVLYRRYILRGLVEVFAAVTQRRPMPLSVAQASAIRSIREWDGRIVAPRFGFDSAEHYYEQASVGPRLHAIGLPALVIAGRHDPMVPRATLEPSLARPGARMTVRWLSTGGHVGFPERLDLGQPGALGLESQVLTWLSRAP